MTETEKKTRETGTLLVKCIVGSQAFGLATPKSDIDIRGVYVLPHKEWLRAKPVMQIADEKNNEVYWELTKFIKELAKFNAQALEMLYSPDHCILEGKEILELVRSKMGGFLSRRSEKPFVCYAQGQISKATGLNKKVFNPKPLEQPNLLDFCYVIEDGKGPTTPLLEWLANRPEPACNRDQKWYAAAKIEHVRGGYALYQQSPLDGYLPPGNGPIERPEHEWRWAYGVVRDEKKSCEIQLNTIPPGAKLVAHFIFNQDNYAQECKERSEYRTWIHERNEERYATTLKHGQGYDSKNMMHCIRILMTALELATTGKMRVDRTDDREFLLGIKGGMWTYDRAMEHVDGLIQKISEAYKSSPLPDIEYSQDAIDRCCMDLVRDLMARGLVKGW
jgi:hypothetical protein